MSGHTRRLCLPYSLQRHGSFAVIACLVILGSMSSYSQVRATFSSCKCLPHLLSSGPITSILWLQARRDLNAQELTQAVSQQSDYLAVCAIVRDQQEVSLQHFIGALSILYDSFNAAHPIPSTQYEAMCWQSVLVMAPADVRTVYSEDRHHCLWSCCTCGLEDCAHAGPERVGRMA